MSGCVRIIARHFNGLPCVDILNERQDDVYCDPFYFTVKSNEIKRITVNCREHAIAMVVVISPIVKENDKLIKVIKFNEIPRYMIKGTIRERVLYYAKTAVGSSLRHNFADDINVINNIFQSAHSQDYNEVTDNINVQQGTIYKID